MYSSLIINGLYYFSQIAAKCLVTSNIRRTFTSHVKIKNMNEQLVQEAVDLFIETLPLATTDIETESYKWHNLYSKECNLYVLMGRMTDEESNEYRIAVKYIRN